MYILYMAQLFKTSNSETIDSISLNCYCNNIIAMPIHARQGFVICDIRTSIDNSYFKLDTCVQ